MRKLCFVLFCALLGVSLATELEDLCLEESTLSERLEDMIMQDNYADTEKIVKVCLTFTDSLISVDKYMEISNIIRKKQEEFSVLGVIDQNLKLLSTKTSLVAPAFEWAQSPSAIFISVKFAHKLDTPPCINFFNEKVLLNNSTLSFTAECKDKRVMYELNFDLLKNVTSVAWEKSSVGRGVITLEKETTAKWVRLMKSREKPKNMHVWFKLNEKYEKEFEALANVTRQNLTSKIEKATQEVDVPEMTPQKEPEKKKFTKGMAKKIKKMKKRLGKEKKSELKEIDDGIKLLEEKKRKIEVDYENKIRDAEEEIRNPKPVEEEKGFLEKVGDYVFGEDDEDDNVEDAEVKPDL